ncbi:hypothetical protein TcasGA2_TC001269 [Tribolium castaneum]|uniref:Uncharacterized protein n=1 Tax=Tribolium castaneum TaxID=7070 RepID=D6WBD5_TRICA|nr:hypothetical protein TcasGA2_TC001269 [Tribolium castaneum]
MSSAVAFAPRRGDSCVGSDESDVYNGATIAKNVARLEKVSIAAGRTQLQYVTVYFALSTAVSTRLETLNQPQELIVRNHKHRPREQLASIYALNQML